MFLPVFICKNICCIGFDSVFYAIIILYKRKGNKKYEETKANDSESLVRKLSGNPRQFNCRDESVRFVHICTLFQKTKICSKNIDCIVNC